MRVKVPGRFVGKNNLGARDDGTSDCGALLLATRELEGHIVFFFFQVKAVEDFGGANEAAGFMVAGVN